ncbi:MAG TPA: LacI family DNA-binding transcriptional regulator [Candidatus Limnocylindrales bacterium]
MSVTILDVARAAGTSKSTVSKVLRDEPNVAPATRARVREAMARLGYRPNAAARSLVQRRARVIGIVVADIRNPFFAEIAHAIAEVAAEAGYGTVLSDLSTERGAEPSFLHLVAEGRADGLVLAAWPGSDAAGCLAAERTPVAYVACRPLGVAADSVTLDEARGAALAVAHLAALGHRRIACIASGDDDSSAADRLAGYRRGLLEAGLVPDAGLVVRARPDAERFGARTGGLAARALLEVEPPPTAIFAADDFLALGAMQALEEIGLRVPDDVSLVGFDDIGVAGLARIGLTTVVQPVAAMGRQVAGILLERLERDGRARDRTTAADGRVEQVVLEPRLVVRTSTARAPMAAAARTR